MRMILLLLLSNLAFAFNLTPLSQSIIVGKNNSTVIYQVSNKNKEPIAVEATIVERNMDKFGKEKQPEVEDGKFLIYPTQIILKPGQKRGIKVQWLGKGIPSEQAYRIKVEQLPIDFKKEKSSGIKLLLKYLGALYVSKEDFKSNINAKLISLKNGKVGLSIENSGKKHQVLRKLKATFTKAAQVISLEGEELKGVDGENILAGLTRQFEVPKNSKLDQIKDIAGWGVKLKYE